MMNPSYKGRALLPMPVIEAARAGDAEAVECGCSACPAGPVAVSSWRQ